VSESQGDFERVFNDCYEQVQRYVARRVAADAVQDVVSDTFLIAWRRHHDLRGEPLPWLLGIARRVAATQRRGTARREALGERLRAEHQPADMTGELEASDPRLAQALNCLPERDREALMLIVWDGLDHRTAAQVMGCTTGSLTVRLHRARRRLARTLQEGEPGRSGLAEQTGSTL
jgi:RNA polymerase sigma-70 factor, ECF subfamily